MNATQRAVTIRLLVALAVFLVGLAPYLVAILLIPDALVFTETVSPIAFVVSITMALSAISRAIRDPLQQATGNGTLLRFSGALMLTALLLYLGIGPVSQTPYCMNQPYPWEVGCAGWQFLEVIWMIGLVGLGVFVLILSAIVASSNTPSRGH